MNTSKTIVSAALAFCVVTAFAYVQVGTAPLDNMPLVVSDIEYARMKNDEAERANVTVYRLELYQYCDSETPFIVGADGVKREVVILSPDDYQVLTDRIERVWTLMNSTDDGRSKLHGKRTARVVKDGGIQFTYTDGFTYFEKGLAKSHGRIRATVVTNRVRNATIPTKPNGISSRQWMMRKKREAILKGEVKEVTVEHDALTGKDIVK